VVTLRRRERHLNLRPTLKLSSSSAKVMFDPSILPPSQRKFFDLWNGKRARRRFPARGDFLFEELAPWLERLHLIEVLPDGDFLFRVFATRSAIRLDQENTGRRMSEMPKTWIVTDAMTDYRHAVAAAEPVFADRSRRHEDSRLYSWKRLVLPLGRDETAIDHLFVCLEYDFI